MTNSRKIDHVVIGVTAVLCMIAALSMLVLEEQSLVVDLVYAGF